MTSKDINSGTEKVGFVHAYPSLGSPLLVLVDFAEHNLSWYS